MLFLLYSVYLKYVSFRTAHKVSDLKAAAIVVLPVLLFIAAVALAFVLFYAAIIGYLTIGQAIVTPVPASVN
jgi:hypothetical protein